MVEADDAGLVETVVTQVEAAIKQAVQKRDELELEQKVILQTYHNKFFKVIPASKVYDVIIAENRFHRFAIRNWGQKDRAQPKK